MKKIVILVLACDVEGYDKMVQSVRDTWGSRVPDNIKIYYIYGTRPGFASVAGSTYLYKNNILISDAPEVRELLLKKTIMSFNWCNQKLEYDYIFRCNCGSYINLEALNKFVEDKPTKNFYCAIKGYNLHGLEFGSGSGYFISRDIVEKIIKCKNNLNYTGLQDCIDDVALGNFIITQLNIPLDKRAHRKDCRTEKEFNMCVDSHTYHYYFCHAINPNLMYHAHTILTA